MNHANRSDEAGSDHNSTSAQADFSDEPTVPLLFPARRNWSRQKYWLGVGVAVAAVIFMVCILIAEIILYSKLNPSPSQDDNLPMNFTARLVTRGQWFAFHPKQNLTPFEYNPPPFVIVSHTAGQACTDRDSCRVIIRNIQADQFLRNFIDISYNFLVGGDGYIYEGRGWSYRGVVAKSMACSSMSVAFVGNFVAQPPPKKQIDAFQLLLDYATTGRNLKADYKMFMQKQISTTESPGEALIRILIRWPHWKPYNEEDKLCKYDV